MATMLRGWRACGEWRCLAWWPRLVVVSAAAAVAACSAADPQREDSAGDAQSRADAVAVDFDGDSSGRRLALVVGNDAYASQAELQNAVNDARAVAAALEEVGFSVETVEDATRGRLTAALGAFAGELRADDVALFYFAGHGVQVDEVNYLLPTDYTGQTADSLRLDAVSAVDVQELLLKARVAMLVLDACRNNPFGGSRSAGAGLAPMEPRGTLVAYAAGAGETAADGLPGMSNGLFTAEFIEALQEPGLAASELFRRVRQEVYLASNEEQFPAVYDGLLADFVFRQSVAVSDAPSIQTSLDGGAGVPGVPLQLELAFWESIRESTNPADFEAYKRQFPSGNFRTLADNRLAALTGRSPLAAPPAPQDSPAPQDPRMVEAVLGLDRAARRRVQQRLASAGFSPGPADGEFGPATRAAIRGWQAALGTAVTGYLDAAGAEVLASGVAPAGTTVMVGAPVVSDVADADLADLDLAQLRRIAEQGEEAAQTELGARYETGRGVARDYEEAVRWYRLAADQGHARGQASLGAAYFNGTGVPRDDETALSWFRQAAEAGDARGQNGLGHLYRYGRGGLQQDDAEALRWYRLAADQEYALAQTNLGWMYATGRGVRQDDAEALRWYRLAADQGFANAQYTLGWMYANGRGVPLDRVEAVQWYRLAADQGHDSARQTLERREAERREAERREAERREAERQPAACRGARRVGVPSSTTGILDHAGDEDCFVISLSEAGRLQVDTDGSTDTVGHLYGPSGLIDTNDDDHWAFGGWRVDRNFLIRQELSRGTYYVVVSRHDGRSTGRYTLKVKLD